MTKTTEEYLKSINMEMNFLNKLHDCIGERIADIEQSINEVYEQIDNVGKY